MSNDDFEKYLQESQSYCSRAEKCESDVRNYLYKQQVDKNIADKVIDELIADKFIDNERYARAFVSDAFKFNKWGKIKIRQALYQKGISEKFIREPLANIDYDEYLSLLENLLKTKLKTTHNDDEYKLRASLFRFATSRGFEAELIEKVLEKILP